LVELFNIFATSCISTIKVDDQTNRLSLAPTLENILSVRGIIACFAGTKLPKCAIKIISAFCLKYVDFHHIFGHVIILTKSFCEKNKSLAIKFFSIFSTTGCLHQITSKSYPVCIFGFI